MKKLPLHPFAFAVFPILSLYSHNLGLFPWTDVLRPIEIALAATAGIYLLVTALLAAAWKLRSARSLTPDSAALSTQDLALEAPKTQATRHSEAQSLTPDSAALSTQDLALAAPNTQDPRPVTQSAAAVTSVAVFLFFTFGYAWTAFQKLQLEWMIANPRDFLWIWIPLCALVLILFGWKRNAAGLTRFFNVAGLILVILPLFTIVTGLMSIKRDLNKVALPGEAGQSASSGANAPDIIYVILDGYGREDEVKQYMHFDNHAFIQELETRGFYVASQARSNYCQTELSLSSSLNMDFVPNLVGPISKDSKDRAPLDQLLDRSAAADFLKKRGYEYIAITSGFPGVNPHTADVLLTDTNGYSLFESSLLANTPMQASSGNLESQYDSRRRKLAAAFDHLIHLGPRGAKPRFVFVHILAPHPPFVFGPHGEPVRPTHTTFGYWDASAFFAVGGTMPEYIKGYTGQLQYVNMMVLRAVDQIRKDSAVPPVIIFQGDHGSRAHLSQDELAKSDVRESFRNLNAYLVPPTVKAKLYPSITPANSFRVLFDQLFGANFPLLPDRSFFTTWDRPYDPVDVTDQVERPL